MINTDLQKAINQQINQEITAAYKYLGMSAYFNQENLSGFAHWCLAQYKEELEHALRLLHYLLDREGQVQLEPIEAASTEYSSVIEVFKTALAQEKKNTQSIDELYKRASALSDHATISHLQWFVDEQVEEEKNVGEALALVERAGTDANAILYLNDKFGSRPMEEGQE